MQPRRAFVEAFANVGENARVGLRTYGDQIEPTAPEGREASCTSDSRLVTPVAPLQREELIGQVQNFAALGDTPMGLAIEQASRDIPAGSTGTIVLFSDGRDECFDADLDGDPLSGPSFGEDPCETAKAVTAGDSAVDRIVTVGFGADSAAETELRCIADSTGGDYTAIVTPEDARNVLPELLVQLSAPREAQRLVGRAIRGSETTDSAPDLVRLDEIGAERVLYTDTIDMNSKRMYRMAEYGPEGGTFTATVFGLPETLGIEFDMRIFVPELDERFFQGQHGDFDAGNPARPTASIRCTDCQITGGPYEAFFVVTLDAADNNLEGTFELEILTEGPGFGGPTTSCSAPQACFYPQEIIDRTAQLEEIREELAGGTPDLAPQDLIDERDRLLAESAEAQAQYEAAEARSDEIAARLPLAPAKSNSYTVPFLMMLVGAGLAFAPWQKLARSPKEDDEGDGDDAKSDDADTDAAPKKSKRRRRGKETNADDAPQEQTTAAAGEITDDSSEPVRTGPTLDVGPPPAVSPNRVSSGNSWDAELEAAKAALAQQRPDRPQRTDADSPIEPVAAAEPVADFPMPAAPDQTISGQFTAAQHAAAKVAAEKIAAQRAAQANEATPDAGPVPDVAPPMDSVAGEPAAVQAAPAEQASNPTSDTSVESAAVSPVEAAVPDAVAVERLDAPDEVEPSAAIAIEASQAAVAPATPAVTAPDVGDQAAAEQAAAEAAEQAAAERAAAEEAARKAAARQAAEEAAAKQAAAEAAAKQAAEEAAAKQAAAEKAAAERAAAEKAAREEAERIAAEKAAAEKAAAEKAAREEAARIAAEKAAAEKAAAEKAARKEAERLAAEKAAREEASPHCCRKSCRRKGSTRRSRTPSRRKSRTRRSSPHRRRKSCRRKGSTRRSRTPSRRKSRTRRSSPHRRRKSRRRKSSRRKGRRRTRRSRRSRTPSRRAPCG